MAPYELGGDGLSSLYPVYVRGQAYLMHQGLPRSVRKIDRTVLGGPKVVRAVRTDSEMYLCSGCRSIPGSIVQQQSRLDCSEFSRYDGALDTTCPGQRSE
jgi:hypothetical protein